MAEEDSDHRAPLRTPPPSGRRCRRRPPSSRLLDQIIARRPDGPRRVAAGLRPRPDRRVRRPGRRREDDRLQGHGRHRSRRAIAEIDKMLSAQLNEILHARSSRSSRPPGAGCTTWSIKTETGTRLKIRVLNVTKKELLKDLEKAAEFDQSALFKKIYEEEYGTFGGHPYGLLVGDYEFGRHPQDMALLEKLSNVAAAAHAPFVAAASPQLFDMDSFTELGNPRDLAKIFESPELVKWRSFRETRGLPLRRPGAAARPAAPALRPGHQAGRGVQLRGGRRRHATTTSTCGGTPPGPRRSGSPTPSPSTAGARRSAASRAAARSRACRSTPSRPTTATSP